MKKFILLCLSIVCSMSMFAQAWDNAKPDKQFTFGVRAGLNLSSFSTDFSDSGYMWYHSKYIEKKGRMGFHVGVIADYNIIKSFAVETGLFYTEKGCKFNPVDDREKRAYYDEEYFKNAEDSVKISYVQLPILALVRLYIANDMHIQLKAGGYVAARVSTSNPPFCIGYFRDRHVYSDYEDYKFYDSYSGWDAGIIAGAGISYKNVYLGLQYELGLTKLMSNHDIKNRNLAISIGYDF